MTAHRRLPGWILCGLAAGLVFGAMAPFFGLSAWTARWIAPWGAIFLNLLKLIAVPLVVTSLVAGVASLADVRKLSRIGGKTIAIYLGTTTLAVIIGLVVVNLLRPGDQVPAEMRQELQTRYQEDAGTRAEQAHTAGRRGPLQVLVDSVPDNLVAAAGDNQRMLQVVLAALLIGVALTQIPSAKAAPVLELVSSLNAVILRLIDLIMYTAPLGVFALLASTLTAVAGDDPSQVLRLLGALGSYCAAVVIGLVAQTAIVYSLLVRFFTPHSLRHFFGAVGPAQLVAFSTSSSGATLPVTMERCRHELEVPDEVASFVLPLGATLNMDGTALYQAVAAVFIAQTVGMDLTWSAQLTLILTAVLASIGTAAVPSAGVIMLVIILESVGIPSAGIAMILGVDRLLDMLRTVTNVTGDAAVAAVVAASEGRSASGDPSPV